MAGAIQIRDGKVLIRDGAVRTCNCCGSTGCNCPPFSTSCVTGTIALAFTAKQQLIAIEADTGTYTTILRGASLSLNPSDRAFPPTRGVNGFALGYFTSGHVVSTGVAPPPPADFVITNNAGGSGTLCPPSTYSVGQIQGSFPGEPLAVRFGVYLTSIPLIYDVNGTASYAPSAFFPLEAGLTPNTNCYSSNESVTLYGILAYDIAPLQRVGFPVSGTLSWSVTPTDDCTTPTDPRTCYAAFQSTLICDSESTAHWSDPVLLSQGLSFTTPVTGVWTGGTCTQTYYIEVDPSSDCDTAIVTPPSPPASPGTDTIEACCDKCYGLYTSSPNCDGTWSSPVLIDTSDTPPLNGIYQWQATSTEPCTYGQWVTVAKSGGICLTATYTPPDVPPGTSVAAGCCGYYVYPACLGEDFVTENATGTISLNTYNNSKIINPFSDGDVLLTDTVDCVIVDTSTAYKTGAGTVASVQKARISYSYSVNCGGSGTFSGSGTMDPIGSCEWQDPVSGTILTPNDSPASFYVIEIIDPDVLALSSCHPLTHICDNIGTTANGCPFPGTYTVYIDAHTTNCAFGTAGMLTISWA